MNVLQCIILFKGTLLGAVCSSNAIFSTAAAAVRHCLSEQASPIPILQLILRPDRHHLREQSEKSHLLCHFLLVQRKKAADQHLRQ